MKGHFVLLPSAAIQKRILFGEASRQMTAPVLFTQPQSILWRLAPPKNILDSPFKITLWTCVSGKLVLYQNLKQLL